MFYYFKYTIAYNKAFVAGYVADTLLKIQNAKIYII